jgi:hypothetical protein
MLSAYLTVPQIQILTDRTRVNRPEAVNTPRDSVRRLAKFEI